MKRNTIVLIKERLQLAVAYLRGAAAKGATGLSVKLHDRRLQSLNPGEHLQLRGAVALRSHGVPKVIFRPLVLDN